MKEGEKKSENMILIFNNPAVWNIFIKCYHIDFKNYNLLILKNSFMKFTFQNTLNAYIKKQKTSATKNNLACDLQFNCIHNGRKRRREVTDIARIQVVF